MRFWDASALVPLLVIVCRDDALAAAAEREGFDVIVPRA